MLRLDEEQCGPFAGEVEERLLAFAEERLPGVEACIVSDYGKGLVSARLAQRVIRQATGQGKAVVIDPRGATRASIEARRWSSRTCARRVRCCAARWTAKRKSTTPGGVW
jgi:bifunctional ADP-heptose synthase (sugar kinase/adenylyltransferase)